MVLNTVNREIAAYFVGDLVAIRRIPHITEGTAFQDHVQHEKLLVIENLTRPCDGHHMIAAVDPREQTVVAGALRSLFRTIGAASWRQTSALKARIGAQDRMGWATCRQHYFAAEAGMSEHIHYAWGGSSLGDFIAAVSERGLVAFEFADSRAAVLNALRARLTNSVFEEDSIGLSGLVGQLAILVDRPVISQSIALDPHGSSYQKHVWSLLQDIPIGQTTTYGELAARLGTRDARDVTEAIASNGIAILIPCHRVVKKDGSLSGYRWSVKRKRVLRERERQDAPFQLV
jgi:AraC family transcriptional regulator, regulatory protein of adaptative response / methylated-DNA-[protein]-cysteine methyltransferase